MEFIAWYMFIGLVVCGISTVFNRIRYYDQRLEFKPAGIVMALTIWPLVVLAWIVLGVLKVFGNDR